MPDKKTKVEPKVTISAVVKHADGTETDYGVISEAGGKENPIVAAIRRLFTLGGRDG